MPRFQRGSFRQSFAPLRLVERTLGRGELMLQFATAHLQPMPRQREVVERGIRFHARPGS
ncbi:MAG TPA: hypothetical protein VIR54_09070 [Vicinamibacterales bacterium]